MTWQRETDRKQPGTAPERGIEEVERQKEESERWRGSERGIVSGSFSVLRRIQRSEKRKTVKMGQDRFLSSVIFFTTGLIVAFFSLRGKTDQ